MKLALIVGIDEYKGAPLSGCVADAQDVAKAIDRNYDMSPNFSTKLVISSEETITRPKLKEQIANLFSQPAELLLLFFAGHGTANNLGGYLVTQDATKYDEGVSMVDVLTLANQSKSREIVILLDCCHSGAFGSVPAISNDQAHLREGISVLAASRSTEPAMEKYGRGLFTSLVTEALYGGTSDLLGRVTVADVYAFADRNLQPWDQRPLFKCHLSSLTPLRLSNPRIDVSVLRQLQEYFPTPTHECSLDPSYEDHRESGDHTKKQAFKNLMAYRSAGLLYPVGHTDMYNASMVSGFCRLTKLGVYYWHVIKEKRV